MRPTTHVSRRALFICEKTVKLLFRFLDDILLMAGCGCILYGLSLWDVIATWITAGVMLISFGMIVAMTKAKIEAKRAAERIIE